MDLVISATDGLKNRFTLYSVCFNRNRSGKFGFLLIGMYESNRKIHSGEGGLSLPWPLDDAQCRVLGLGKVLQKPSLNPFFWTSHAVEVKVKDV